MKKTYYLLFYKLSQFFKAVSDDNWEKHKALVIINGLCGLLFMELLIWWIIVTKTTIHASKFWLIIPVFIIVTFNYNFFMSKNKWNNYKVEFRSYSLRTNRVINLLVLVFILVVLGSLIFAFYKMSLIDWSKYR